ncbi:hypothetical protein ACQP2E_20720 [Actinoplanes sp. CA-015351]|uniref:hypothetical protein n=1 Tax=Actinoplanes sp. CA-015351 TaxID=3239897 RepID=UPI003D98A26F
MAPSPYTLDGAREILAGPDRKWLKALDAALEGSITQPPVHAQRLMFRQLDAVIRTHKSPAGSPQNPPTCCVWPPSANNSAA